MTLEFSTPEPAYTPEGDAYCPVEERRRGPLAVAASMGVMLAGAAFLAYSMAATPQRADANQIVSVAVDTTALAAMTGNPATSTTAPRNLTASVEDALAQSRAARANAKTVLSIAASHANDGLSPRLKPIRAASASTSTQDAKDGFAPSLKPALAHNTQASTAERGFFPRIKPDASTVTAPAPIRPIRLGGLFMASPDDRPPPVFFQSDIERKIFQRTTAPVTLAADIKREFGKRRIRISKGDNFVDALKRAGIRAIDRNDAAYAFGKEYNLRRLQPGQEFSLTLAWPNQTLFQLAAEGAEPEARLMGLEFRADPQNLIKLRRSASGVLKAEKSEVRLMTRVMAISGSINGSLYLSAQAQGAPSQAIADLANIFAYDIDFQREIFGGDEFEAIFNVHYDSEGRIVSSGDILFARMKWRGRTKEKAYYRFSGQHGVRADYYDAAGQSAKRLLMKTPIDGARLSSRFGSRRHPISGYKRQHKGVDFAARRGTPIYAAGDGVVERANRYGGYGNYIRIGHANGYQTAYAHMNGFRKGVSKGKRVRQGDVIGYVGSTGASTGPHLHYEVHKNGKAVNPQKLKIALGKQLKGGDFDRFKAQRDFVNAMRLPEDEGTGLYARDDAGGSAL